MLITRKDNEMEKLKLKLTNKEANKLAEQDEIAKALTSANTELEQDQICYVTIRHPMMYSYKLMQFGKPRLIFNDIKNQLCDALKFVDIFIEDKDGKVLLLSESSHYHSRVTALVVRHKKNRSFFNRKPKTKTTMLLDGDTIELANRLFPNEVIESTNQVDFFISASSEKSLDYSYSKLIQTVIDDE